MHRDAVVGEKRGERGRDLTAAVAAEADEDHVPAVPRMSLQRRATN
jgi:hypothetical protein